MRGFRGSRAAQNFNNRASGRQYERRTQRESFLRLVEDRQQPKEPTKLPAWLQGLAEAKPVEVKPVAVKPVAAKPVAAKPVAAKAVAAKSAKKVGAKKPATKAKSPTRKAA